MYSKKNNYHVAHSKKNNYHVARLVFDIIYFWKMHFWFVILLALTILTH